MLTLLRNVIVNFLNYVDHKAKEWMGESSYTYEIP
jgi:hypothetical protein